jgi:CRP-like cAMP-binding protein
MRWDLVAGVPEEEVRRLISVARRRTFGRGEVVFHRGDPADSLHLVQKGRFGVRIMTPLGDTATIAVRGPGESFGEMALVDGAQRSATVAALEEAETLAVHQAEFHRLRKEHPQVDRVLIGFLAGEVRRHNELLLEALYIPVERRVLRRLVELATTYARGDGEIPLTQEQLADLAGTSRATVNKVLREEQAKGTIDLRRGKTLVLQPDELARRAR